MDVPYDTIIRLVEKHIQLKTGDRPVGTNIDNIRFVRYGDDAFYQYINESSPLLITIHNRNTSRSGFMYIIFKRANNKSILEFKFFYSNFEVDTCKYTIDMFSSFSSFIEAFSDGNNPLHKYAIAYTNLFGLSRIGVRLNN